MKLKETVKRWSGSVPWHHRLKRGTCEFRQERRTLRRREGNRSCEAEGKDQQRVHYKNREDYEPTCRWRYPRTPDRHYKSVSSRPITSLSVQNSPPTSTHSPPPTSTSLDNIPSTFPHSLPFYSYYKSVQQHEQYVTPVNDVHR